MNAQQQQYRFRGSIDPRKAVRNGVTVITDQTAPTVAQIRLYDVIDSWGGEWGVSASEMADALDLLDPAVTDVHLHINSPGGEVWEGIAMLNTLRNHPAKITAVVDGLAASAASFIAAGADETVMGRNSQMMIHDAWGISIGPAAAMTDAAARLDKISDNIAAVYTDKAGGTMEGWRAAMLAETWYNADEAVAAGLADRVDVPADTVAADEEAAAAALASFDLSVFKHAGRDDAPAPVAARVEDSRAEWQKRRHGMNQRRIDGRTP